MINLHDLWTQSAKQYEFYSTTFPQYRETSKALVEQSKLNPNMSVVDLACGTGITTDEILKQNCAVYSIDFSDQMLQFAKKRCPSAKFIQAEASEWADQIPCQVDRVICNSAFWQFPNKEKVLDNINQVLKPEGLFLFSMTQTYFEINNSNPRPSIQALQQSLEKRGIPFQLQRQKMSKEELYALISEAKMTIVEEKEFITSSRTPEDLTAFFQIPATAPFFNNVDQNQRNEILSEMRDKMKNTPPSASRWILFSLKKL